MAQPLCDFAEDAEKDHLFAADPNPPAASLYRKRRLVRAGAVSAEQISKDFSCGNLDLKSGSNR